LLCKLFDIIFGRSLPEREEVLNFGAYLQDKKKTVNQGRLG